MAHIPFTEREFIHRGPTPQRRERLRSSPENLKSLRPGKVLQTPVPSNRKAFGAVNKKISTPAFNEEERKLLKPQETKVKCLPLTKVEEYPEMEKFIPYDPLEYERYSVPEDLVHLGNFALPGLACVPHTPLLNEEMFETLHPLPKLSPMKMTEPSGGCSELEAFLETINELTVDLPPESDF